MPLSRGDRLRRLREQKGIEQQEAAAGIHIGAPYLSMLERDRKGQGPDQVRAVLRRAADYYGVMLEYLVAETAQEYIGAFVRAIAPGALPYTVGDRLALVLGELQLRWGEEAFSVERVAAAIGATPDVLRSLLADTLPATDTVLQQLSSVTGAPTAWLLPALPADPTQPYQRVIRIAVENELPPGDLEALIQVWLTARKTKKEPSG